MPKTYLDVQREYEAFRQQNPNEAVDLGTFAQEMDAAQGVQDRASAYRPAWYKDINAGIDRAIEFTGAPQGGRTIGRFLGEGVDALAGTHVADTLADVGGATPRMVGEGLATLPTGGAGPIMRGLGALGKVLGYGSAATRGYAETESPAGAAISAGSLALGNKLLLPKEMGGVDVGGRVRTGLQNFLAPELKGTALQAASTAERWVPGVAGVSADIATATALNEATRQAQLTVTPDAMRAEGDRDPFTQENIAGNIAGAAFFTPQIVSALRNRPRVSVGQARQLHDFLTKNEEALQDLRGAEPLPGTEAPAMAAAEDVSPDAELRGRHEALYGIIRSSLDAAEEFDKIGDVTRASELRESALRHIDEAASGRFSPMPPDLIEKVKVEVDKQARMQPMSDPTQFEGFVNEVRGIVDMMNEGREAYETELAQRQERLEELPRYSPERVRAQKELDAWKADYQENVGKSWHPNARSKEVVDRLWANGSLQPLTPEWLAQEFHATFDDSGNPTFSTRVVAQKVANYAADNLDAALKRDAAIRKADPTVGAQLSQRKQNVIAQYNKLDHDMVRALVRLPQELRRDLERRTVEMRSDEFHKKGSSVTESRYAPWQEALVLAATTYDPATQSVVLSMRGAGKQRVPARTLIEKGVDGKYTWEPNSRVIPKVLGGKAKTGTSVDPVTGRPINLYEENIEAVPTREGQDAVGALDEDEFKAALAETSQEPTRAGDFGSIHFEGEQRPALDMPEESSTGEVLVGEKMRGVAKTINKALDTLTDAQVWALVQGDFRSNFKNVTDPRAQNIKLAVRAAMEAFRLKDDAPVGPNARAFYEAERARGLNPTASKSEKWNVRRFLRDYFQTHAPVEGGEGKLPPHEERLARIVRKLMDPKSVERARTGIRAQADVGDRPLITFSAPVRLRDWVGGKYRISVTPDAQGRIPGKSVETVLTKLGISKDEMALYRAAGLDELVRQERVGVAELAAWLEEKAPKVEVKKLEPMGSDNSSRRRSEIQHELETLGVSVDNEHGELSINYKGDDAPDFADLPKRAQVLITEYSKLVPVEGGGSDAATGRYGVEPKELKDMPGAVDILVRVPMKAKDSPSFKSSGSMARENPDMDYTAYRGPHFGESDRNVLASVRGYVETLPSGEKVFHVFEVQSDWGQAHAKFDKNKPEGAREGDSYRFNNKVADHPLLAVYEQLALKAAIEHARSLGIKKVAVSDAETAMMTEGHDRYATHKVPATEKNKQLAIEMWRKGDLGGESWMKQQLFDLSQGQEYGSIRPDQLAWWEERGFDTVRNLVEQEPGMRAAYDVRLPQTMEKLVGGRGVPVDFGDHGIVSKWVNSDRDTAGLEVPGSPIFKMPDGDPKYNVTARLYDITSAPDRFAAFGYGKPMVDEAGTPIVDSPDQGTIVNQPAAGAFVGDVERTFRAWVDKHLGRAGYSGSSREFMVEVATALARQIPNLDFFRIVGSEYGLAGTGDVTGQVSPRGKVGINLDRAVAPGDEFRAVQQVLQTLAHEITHMDGFIRDGLVPRPDAYSDERTRLLNNLDHLAQNLNDDERMSILTVLNQSVPERYRSMTRQADGRPYGTSNPDEFVAEVVSKTVMMLANDTAAGRAAAKEALDYGPIEVRELARDGFRTVRDTLLAMQEAVANGKALTGRTDPVILGGAFDALVSTAQVMTDFKQSDVALALGRQAIANLDTGGGSRPPARMTDAVWFRGQKELTKSMKDAPVLTQTTIEAINEVQDSVFSPRAFDEKHTPNAFARWLYPFTNLMTSMERQGVALARPVLENIMSLEPGISRIYSSLLGDFLKKKPDGSYNLDDEHPLVRLVSEEKKGPWRDGVNAVSAWQQENNSKPMFVKDEKGVITVNPDPKLKAQAAWDKIRHRIPAEQQQYVMGASVAFDAANARAGSTLVYHLQQSNVSSVATYFMAANKRMGYDQAWALAQRVHDAYLSGNVASLNGTAPQEQLQGVQRLLIGNATKEAPLGDGLLAKFVEVKNMLEARTGFRSESLPHDWIVKYEEDGKVRFDSRPTEEQARYLANRITARGGRIHGEILNRREMRTPTDFDHPDTILAKVAETEDFVWKNFIAEMEQTHGVEIAEALTQGYTPVAQSIKELGTQGLAKFLRQRRSLVDREQFDYIDGQFAYMQRLSSSIAIRSMQQQIRLILNDPRARFMPSFRKLVQEHVAEMMVPQSDAARQMKAFTSTYFLGANIASALVNGTQSVSTLVPWLIAGVDARHPTTGGPAKAWKDMGLAMGDAVSFATGSSWEKTAASATTKDPRAHTLEESLAVAYRTHVENGGVQQTVIDDLVYGRDQRMLMNAKFGHGDYGPTPLSKMVGDGVYLGSQLMMTMYKWVERFNARTAFLAGARQAFELGLRGDELYQYATKMQSLATFGGGRANAPGLVPKLSTQYTRSAVGLVNSLQQYGYGMVATYGQLMKDSLGQSKGLTGPQVRQAQKAFGTMLMTQVAVAGALGLPFAAASLTLLEKLFGIPATQAIRQGLASLSDDEETGSVIAETGLNGFANQALGLDVSSRLGTSNLLGTSAYRGFDLRDMVGPAGSIIGNAAEALNLFGQQRPMEAFHKLVPPAFKNVVEMSNTKTKYGDYGLRDASGALLYTPTDNQQLGYALGFRPRELSQKRAMQSMLMRADERTQAKRDRELDGASRSLSMGDPSVALRLAHDAQGVDPTIDPRDILRQVMDRSVAAQSPRDLLATGSRWNEAERQGIARTFGAGVNERQSEVENQNLRLQLAGLLGDPRLAPTVDTYRRAAVIDQLVQTQGMPRSEAVRLAEFLGL